MLNVTAVTGPLFCGKTELCSILLKLSRGMWMYEDSGNIIRRAMEGKSKTACELRSFDRAKTQGNYLPNFLTVPVFKKWINELPPGLPHLILDDWPRNEAQAQTLRASTHGGKLLVVMIDVSEEEIMMAARKANKRISKEIIELNISAWDATRNSLLNMSGIDVICTNYSQPYKRRLEEIVRRLPIPEQRLATLIHELESGSSPAIASAEELDKRHGHKTFTSLSTTKAYPLAIPGAVQVPIMAWK